MGFKVWGFLDKLDQRKGCTRLGAEVGVKWATTLNPKHQTPNPQQVAKLEAEIEGMRGTLNPKH